MSKKKSHARSRREVAAKTALFAAFPLAFPENDSDIKPLAISTRDDVTEWMDTAKPGVERRAVIAAVQHHCARTTYKRTLIAGSMRINLEGRPIEPVSEEAAAHAAECIERMRAQRLAHAEAKAQRDAEPKAAPAKAASKTPAPAKAKAKAKAPKPVVAPAPVAKPVAKAAVIVKKRRSFTAP